MKLGQKGELLEDLVLDFTGIEARYAVEKSNVVHVRRETTSSRRPGKTIEGQHTRVVGQRALVKCVCGSWRWNDDEPHALRWNDDRSAQVDCMGIVEKTQEEVVEAMAQHHRDLEMRRLAALEKKTAGARESTGR